MSIDRFFTVTITNTRMTWVGNASSEVAVGSFNGHVQQASPAFAESIGQAWGKTFSIWCAKGTDVAEGDTLTIATGDYAGAFSVKGKQLNAIGGNEHLELVAIKDV